MWWILITKMLQKGMFPHSWDTFILVSRKGKMESTERLSKEQVISNGDMYSEVNKARSYQIRSVQSLSRVQLFATPWTEECQASLSITNSWNLLKLISIESVMPLNHLIFCHPLLLLPSVHLFQPQDIFQGVSSSHQVAKVWEFQFQHQSFQRIFRTDFL